VDDHEEEGMVSTEDLLPFQVDALGGHDHGVAGRRFTTLFVHLDPCFVKDLADIEVGPARHAGEIREAFR